MYSQPGNVGAVDPLPPVSKMGGVGGGPECENNKAMAGFKSNAGGGASSDDRVPACVPVRSRSTGSDLTPGGGVDGGDAPLIPKQRLGRELRSCVRQKEGRGKR